jgi:hypothetical protein
MLQIQYSKTRQPGHFSGPFCYRLERLRISQHSLLQLNINYSSETPDTPSIRLADELYQFPEPPAIFVEPGDGFGQPSVTAGKCLVS